MHPDIERWARAGATAPLVELLGALEDPSLAYAGQPWAREGLAERVERSLALTPGQAQAEAVIAIAQIPRVASVQRPRDGQRRQRQLAAYLAAAQPPAVLFGLLEHQDAQTRAPELLAALLQELVVRGHTIDAVPAARALAQQLGERGHPLDWLPLRLMSAEGQFHRYLPRYSYQVSGSSMLPAGLPKAGGPWPPAPALVAVEVTQPGDQVRLESAVADWRDRSNGMIEARLFALDPPLAHTLMSPAVLLQLGLACLADTPEDAVQLAPTAVTAALTTLFAAAVVGGAYTQGLGGAYSRLAAWQSLAALIGLGPDATFEAVVARASACSWWAFDAPGWFSHVAWDLGLVALHAGGDGLGVLAATDTD
jgi:hypothetical protein